MALQCCGCLVKEVKKVKEWAGALRGEEIGRTPASCSIVSTLVKQTKAKIHIHEVVFVVISCQINCL